MALKVDPSTAGNVAKIEVSGKLTKEDYEVFRPLIESLIDKHGKIRILFEMSDFHGWDAGALWEDIKFDAKHYSDIEKLAMVGEKKWEEWMAKICRPFTTAELIGLCGSYRKNRSNVVLRKKKGGEESLTPSRYP